jgi:two-component system chemotaxis sensor kinase CheA
MDLAKYLDLYLTEGREHLSLMRKGLPGEGPVPADGVNDLFRHAHSIKGMAASMGFEATAQVAHELESLLGRWRGGHSASLAQVRVLEAAVDALDSFFDEVQRSSSDAASADASHRMLSALRDGEGVPSGAEASAQGASPVPAADLRLPAPDAPRSLLRVAIDPACPLPAARLMVVYGRLRTEVPECLIEPGLEQVQREGLRAASFLLPMEAPLKELARTVRDMPDVAAVELERAEQAGVPAGANATLVKSLRVDAEDLDELRAMASGSLSRLNQFESTMAPEERRRHHFWLESERAHLNRLFDRVLAMRLVSFDALVERLGRTAREVSARLGKPVRLEVSGSEERVDRGLLERLLDPLVHLVRNAVDHGLETGEERRGRDKPEEGLLRLDIHRESEALLVSLEDDGKGIDVELIRQAAVEKGLFTPSEASLLDRARLLDLLTAPAFSTRREVSDVSGRGVGLDVVRSSVESLGGHLEMSSEPGRGSRFTLVVPSATTLTRILVFGWDDGVRYGLPASQIGRLYSLASAPLVWSGNRRFLQAGDELLPVLNWRQGPVGREGVGLRLVGPERDHILLASRIYQAEKVVIMPWGPPLEMVSEWMGGALLATGEIAYILDGRVLAKREGD